MRQTKNPDLEQLLEGSQSTKKGIVINKRESKSAHLERCGRIRLGIISTVLFFIIYCSLYINTWTEPHFMVTIPPDDKDLPGPKAKLKNLYKTTTPSSTNVSVPSGYLVYGPGCQMPDFDPLAADVMSLFHKEKYEQCSSKKPLTKIIKNYTTDTVILHIDEKLKSQFTTSGLKISTCCYQEISRAGEGKHADDHYNLTDCVHFTSSITLPETTEFILVKCSANDKHEKVLYTNAHAIIRERTDLKKRLSDQAKKNIDKKPLSVLMIGIDSISRLNLIRAMPHTAQHLYNTGWLELKGYNKIDDNTFPNLMAILVGYNSTLAYTTCDPKTVGKLDSCPFMWNYYKDNGYVTGYAEDESSINTFNYHKYGFFKPPTDYYLRPFTIVAEKNLPIKYKSSLKYCLGFQHYADYIYDYALDFATVYKDTSYFGLFWTNTFSHNAISDPSSMDMKIKSYIEELDTRGILNTSMVVFFSDHGLRFGPVRKLETGWLEERLPFIFIWLPSWFKEEYPQLVQNLKINRNRLTNPYDIHMTLKHVLQLTDDANLPVASSCPLCQSIFEEMPWNRTCEDSAITAHWCTCTPFKSTNVKAQVVKLAVKFVLEYIHADLNKHDNGTKKLCAELKIKTINYARKGSLAHNLDTYDILIVFETTPGDGSFETTVRYNVPNKTFELTGSVSRLNSYDQQSHCMHVDYLKKYCYCLKKSKGRRK